MIQAFSMGFLLARIIIWRKMVLPCLSRGFPVSETLSPHQMLALWLAIPVLCTHVTARRRRGGM